MKKFTSILTLLVALLFGATTDAIAQPRIRGNVYGGGENAKVQSSTSVTLNNGEVYGDIYGGGAMADVEGNTEVLIDTVPDTKKKGKFAGNVFGGGKGKEDGTVYANVLGNTSVTVKGGEIIWKKAWDATNRVEKNWDGDEDFFYNNKFLQYHNIYAGGNYASIIGTWSDDNTLSDENTGTASLKMTRGLIGSDLLSKDKWKEAYAQHENPHFYAFGGGYGIFTKAHKSEVEIMLPMVSDESASGGDEQLARPMHAPGDPGEQTELDIDLITDNYGVAWTTVLGILGGGYNGHVEETNVLVGDATYAHRVYGGGLGSYEGWVEAGKPADMDAAALAAGKVGTVGPLTGEPSATEPVAHVTLAGGHIHGDVFGGGAGVASGKEEQDGEGNWSIDRTAANNTFTDFTEIARVKGNTLVETTSYETYLKNILTEGERTTFLASHPNKNANTDPDEKKRAAYPLYQRAQVFGHVYGGGDVANVTGNTNVKLFGGDVFGYTFGAGLGRLTTEAADYTAIGNVTGNSLVEISETVKLANIVHLTADYKEPTYKPTAWDDIYGGGRNGVTEGNATVQIHGGKIGDNIFGGGLGDTTTIDRTLYITSADVKGNTNVTVTGGSYQWRQIADIDGNIKTFPKTIPDGYKGSLDGYDKPFDRSDIDNKAMHDQLFEPVKDFFNYRTASYTRDHSIYGGGNIACKVGTYASDAILDGSGNIIAPTSGGVATVDMQHGLFEDEDIMWTDDEQWNLATLCRYFACENATNYQFGVFGGGYGANTKVGETQVNLRMGVSDANKVKWNTYMGNIIAMYGKLDSQTQDDYYGGGVGENAQNRYLTARMARSINVPSHTVLTAAGGGFAGYVAGNTSVHQYERSGSLRVFGGGIGQRPTDTELATLDSDGAAALTYGQVGGNTSVDIEYGVVVKDVFGGGAGIESIEYSSGNYFDFTNMARVKGKTDVTVHTTAANDPTQTLVYGMVFGGGDVANVGDPASPVDEDMRASAITHDDNSDKLRTKVTVTAGCVFGDVFAGGSGRTKAYCDDYEKLGAVYGNTQLVINKTGENSTWLWKDAYGGGRNGLVYGNTLVDVEGGWLGSDIYGGGLGNLDTKYNPVSGVDEPQVTKATVKHNANILVRGGQYCLSQSWDEVTRNWHPMNKDKANNAYSSQYDPIHNKFLIGHNIYGGGNVACDVVSDTWVDVHKGLLPKSNRLGHKDTENLFEEDEWENIYNKHASPYFSVFGGGYGENTSVDNSHVTVNMGTTGTQPSDPSIADKDEKSEIFTDRQTLMDVIGGGFQGGVTNTCYVDIDGYTFMRNAFGGAYYAMVGNTDVKVTRANMDNVYGGGMMGDVKTNVNVKIGTEVNDDDYDNDDDKTAALSNAETLNSNLIINEDVYGANDVSGYVGAQSLENGEINITDDSEGVKLKLYGGTIKGSVYGGGNGDYLYLIDDEVAMVTVEDDYVITDDYSSTIYRVPLRASDFPSLAAMSNQQKMVNVISYRPSTMKVDIDFKGNSEDDRLKVNGNIFGGGNSATISDFDGEEDTYEASVKMNVGSHIQLGGVYLGSDGDALFDSKQGYMTYFPMINDLTLYEEIDWTTPENQNIPIKFLPTPKDKRPQIYKNNIDLYFMPVEMALMPELTWGKARQNNSVNLARASSDPLHASYTPVDEDEDGLIDAEIGTFCCGGNRGNMDTDTNFHINFPEGLTITDKIVGGCNNANFTRDIYNPQDGTTTTLDHTGGYLLGSHGVGTGRTPQIHLTLRNKFKITETETIEGITYYKPKGNVYGGCYDRGVVRGDILLEVYSNMLNSGRDGSGNICGLDSVMLRRTTDKGYTVASVYGAGFGPESWVRGDTEVRLGDETHTSNLLYTEPSDPKYDASGLASSCNYIFGGGRQGNVIGNTNVQIRNGRVAGCVVGASYAGTLYGSAQTMVGYPELYYRTKVSRSYDILRVDEDPEHADFLDDNLRPLIQKKVYYTKGDLVTATAYNGIRDRIVENARIEHNNDATFNRAAAITAAETELAAYFDKEHSIPANNNWSNVNIQIDKAVYGGGYALASGSGSYTVMKYTDEHKFLDDDIRDNPITHTESIYGFNGTLPDSRLEDFTKYGGNTFVIVGDVSENYDLMAETTTDFSSTGGHGVLPAVPDAEKNTDHIKLSSSQLKEVHLGVGNDVFGLFKELTKREVEPDKYGDGGWDTVEHLAEGKEPSGQYMKITTEAVFTAEDKANGSKYFEFTGEGGIYGDGRLSISEGFRICDVIGYGYNGSTPEQPSLMNCIHRFDIARFKDCCISLLGDRDYTSAEGSQANAVAYSMARVSEILMESALTQNLDLKGKNQKHSRNYVGLSSAQFDLSAVKSNDVFSDADDAALYHNRHGAVIRAGMIIDGTEDDLGGVKHFTEPLSYYNVKKWYLNQYEDGTNKSNYYDDVNAQVRNEKQFQMRNSATARNMFGIFSGYALNVHSTHYDQHRVPTNYYGPVVGVFEVDLIGTRAGEAGGYAYAQNIHREDAKDNSGNYVLDDGGKHVHSFLETSGNFVFPATEVRKVVDNCTPYAYNITGRDIAEAHYWYVTGFKYYYNTTITGYTYDGKTKFFESDNSITKRLVMNGTKEGQTVFLKNFHWLPRHSDPYYANAAEYNEAWGTSLTTEQFNALPEEKRAKCDIEHYYLTTTYDHTNVDGAATDAEAWTNVSTADDRIHSPFYNLNLSLSEFGNYTESEAGVDYPYISMMPQDTWHMSDGPVAEQYKIYNDQHEPLTNTTNRDNPVLGLRLIDCMNNNGKDENGITYYSKHLEDPCVAKIVLTTPAVNSHGEPIYSNYIEILKSVVDADTRTGTDYTNDPYYAFDTNGDYYTVTLEKAKELVAISIPVFQPQKAKYEPASDKAYNPSLQYYVSDGLGGYNTTTVTDEADFNSRKSQLYYFIEGAHPENYIYDITLTIKYIKGPSYEGHIDIKNCALPGEMIRVSHENLRVESDETSLPHNGSFWTFGPGKKVWNDELDHSKGYHWELIDETGTKEREAFDVSGQRIRYRYNNPETRNFYYPYNPYVNDPLDEFYKKITVNLQDKAVSPLMNSGTYHDFVSVEKPDYFIPAYYFMNGYVAQYSFTVNGIDEIFTTTIHPEDTLLVHNYHRMAMAANTVPADGAQDIKVSHAMKEYSNVPGIDDPLLTEQQKKDMTAEWQSVHKRPRVYIQDVDDFMAFAQYLQRTDNATPQNIHIRDAVAAIVGDDAEHSIDAYPSVDLSYINRYGTNHGEDVEFILMNDIDLTGKSWTAIDFNGILHGNGHVITGLRNDESLFDKLGNGAHIYNLGLPKGKIAETKNGATYHCSYTFDTNEKGGVAPNQYDIHHVYRMDGTDYTGYDEDDWRTGRVAYDLNEFYLAERLDRHTDAPGEGANKDTHVHSGYVEEIYGDGEYRFSRWSTNENNSEYLRSKAEPYYQWGKGLDQEIKDDPSIVSNHYYRYTAAQHVISHKIDEPRAYFNDDAMAAVLYANAEEYNEANGTDLDNDAFDALSESDKTKTPAIAHTLNEFRPLIDEAKFNSTETLTDKKNDYIFFGQTVNKASYTNDLGTVGSNLPHVIDASSRTSGVAQYVGVTHNVDAQNNRIWRAYGFYKSRQDDTFHFNKAAWALHPDLTAIDFTGLHNGDTNCDHKWRNGYYPTASSYYTQPIFYPMIMDMPEGGLTSFGVDSNKDYNADGTLRSNSDEYDNSAYGRVTQNLLVYHDGLAAINKTEDRDIEEEEVLYHNIRQKYIAEPSPQLFYDTDYFHLVDKQDFNAPINFAVNQRAWYERLPQGYRNASVTNDYNTASAWEGISLPFSYVTKVSGEPQEIDGETYENEISHFYGETTPAMDADPALNDRTLHHEYWLTGMVAADGDKATFARPTAFPETPNFYVAGSYMNYEYENNYYRHLPDYANWNDTRNDENDDVMDAHNLAWYFQPHTFTAYAPQVAAVPYLCAFPGNDYYEFSLQGDSEKGTHDQKVTIEHSGNKTLIAVSDDEANPSFTPGFDNGRFTTKIGSHYHIGTYLHETVDDGHLGINAIGNAFDKSTERILPFRTYMRTDAMSPARIYITENGEGEIEVDKGDKRPEDDLNKPQIYIYVAGRTLFVESNYPTTLHLYNVSGQFVRTLNIKPGKNEYRDLPRSVYIVGGKKFIIP